MKLRMATGLFVMHVHVMSRGWRNEAKVWDDEVCVHECTKHCLQFCLPVSVISNVLVTSTVLLAITFLL